MAGKKGRRQGQARGAGHKRQEHRGAAKAGQGMPRRRPDATACSAAGAQVEL